MDLLQLVVLMHQYCLLLYPFSVELAAFLLQLFTLTQQVHEFVLLWVFALVIGLAHQLIVQLVESSDLVLFLFIDVVALLDLHLVCDDQVLLIVLLN